LACALFACIGAAPVVVPPSALEFYRDAIANMRDMRQPAFVTYTVRSESDGLQIGLTSIEHLVWLQIGPGTTPNVWTIRHRTQDYSSAIVDEKGTAWLSQRSFFDPTWYGSLRALRDGMIGYQNRTKPLSGETPEPVAASGLKVIAIESVMGAGIYDVADRGAATCANGDPGHAMHLTSRERSSRHQLSDVIVDTRSMRFCMVRFGVPSIIGFRGYLEQNYADVGGYWMQTGGVLEGTLRVLGISTHHGTWRYTIDAMTFPREIPADAFQMPSMQ
jgi:hypothetical protein